MYKSFWGLVHDFYKDHAQDPRMIYGFSHIIHFTRKMSLSGRLFRGIFAFFLELWSNPNNGSLMMMMKNNIYSGMSNSAIAGLSGALVQNYKYKQ